MPVTVNPWAPRNQFGLGAKEINLPLTVKDYETLQRIDSAIESKVTRWDAAREATQSAKPRPDGHYKLERDNFETFKFFTGESTLILVAISGGGARAAALGAHTMSLLEQKYNEVASTYYGGAWKAHGSVFNAIDGYSTVSGGSIYGFHLAVKAQKLRFSTSRNIESASTLSDTPGCEAIEEGDVTRAFEEIACNASPSLQQLGRNTGLLYLNFEWLVTLTTDVSYTEIMAVDLDDLSRETAWGWSLIPLHPVVSTVKLGGLRKMSSLPPRPFFLFNSTSLETGTPFVITQSIMHVPSDSLAKQTARLDRVSDDSARPLQHELTLEDIGSSPAAFPVAAAAMASAAYPLGMEALPLRKFGYNASREQTYVTKDLIHLADGGVYDNSGLLSAVDLFEYLHNKEVNPGTKVGRLILLSINADTSEYASDYTKRASDLQPWYAKWLPFSLLSFRELSPLRVGALGFQSLELIHTTNKRRAEQIAVEAIRSEQKTHKELEQPLLFFPVNLLQLSDSDSDQIAGGHQIFEKLRDIGTSYTLTESEDNLIAEAAKRLVASPQREGWDIGLTCPDGKEAEIFRLDEAFAFALLRSRMPCSDTKQDCWDENGPLVRKFASRWCRHPN